MNIGPIETFEVDPVSDKCDETIGPFLKPHELELVNFCARVWIPDSILCPPLGPYLNEYRSNRDI